jgi:hypothetical protein
METIFARLQSAVADSPVEGAYPQDLMAAIAAFAALFAILVVVYLVIRATYLVIRLFSVAALPLTAILAAIVVLIGWLNR